MFLCVYSALQLFINLWLWDFEECTRPNGWRSAPKLNHIMMDWRNIYSTIVYCYFPCHSIFLLQCLNSSLARQVSLCIRTYSPLPMFLSNLAVVNAPHRDLGRFACWFNVTSDSNHSSRFTPQALPVWTSKTGLAYRWPCDIWTGKLSLHNTKTWSRYWHYLASSDGMDQSLMHVIGVCIAPEWDSSSLILARSDRSSCSRHFFQHWFVPPQLCTYPGDHPTKLALPHVCGFPSHIRQVTIAMICLNREIKDLENRLVIPKLPPPVIPPFSFCLHHSNIFQTSSTPSTGISMHWGTHSLEQIESDINSGQDGGESLLGDTNYMISLGYIICSCGSDYADTRCRATRKVLLVTSVRAQLHNGWVRVTPHMCSITVTPCYQAHWTTHMLGMSVTPPMPGMTKTPHAPGWLWPHTCQAMANSTCSGHKLQLTPQHVCDSRAPARLD